MSVPQLLAFDQEIQRLVPVAIVILYILGHVASIFGKKKPSEAEPEIEVEVELEEEPARTPPASGPPPVPARPTISGDADRPVLRPGPPAPFEVGPRTRPDAPVGFPGSSAPRPPRRARPAPPEPPVPEAQSESVRELRRRQNRQQQQRPRKPRPPATIPDDSPVSDGGAAAAYGRGLGDTPWATDAAHIATPVRFGEPTPDRVRQPGAAARGRLYELLREPGNLQTAFLLTEVFGRPLSEREDA